MFVLVLSESQSGSSKCRGGTDQPFALTDQDLDIFSGQ